MHFLIFLNQYCKSRNIDLQEKLAFSVGTEIKHDYIRKILYHHSNLTKKLKFTAAKLSWFTVNQRKWRDITLYLTLFFHNRKLKIPLPLPRWVYSLQYLLPVYFGFAVAFDVYITMYDLVNPNDLSSSDLHPGMVHVGGPYTVLNNNTDTGTLIPGNGSVASNLTNFITGDSWSKS